MPDTRRNLSGLLAKIFCLQLAFALSSVQSALPLEEIMVSYAGPTVTFLPAEIARQRGFLREQNLDMKLLLTRSEVDRAAIHSGPVRRLSRRREACQCGSSFSVRLGRSGAWSCARKRNR